MPHGHSRCEKNRSRRSRRRLLRNQSKSHLFEILEARRLLASDWQNRDNTFDVNRDMRVTALDALVSINELGRRTVIADDGMLPDREDFNEFPFWDVTGDNHVSALDPLRVINTLGRDSAGPTILASLANDTGSNTALPDNVTSDPTISGIVVDTLGVQTLAAQLDNGDAQTIVLNDDGSFSYTPTLSLDGTDDAAHSIVLTSTDPKGNETTLEPLSFVLDTQAIDTLDVDLAADSDTSPVGDQTTSLSSVELHGQVEPLAIVDLLGVRIATEADATGSFSFVSVPLADGVNDFLFRVTDVAGNVSELSAQITKTDSSAPVVNVGLVQDTGLDPGDAINKPHTADRNRRRPEFDHSVECKFQWKRLYKHYFGADARRRVHT